MRHVVKVRYYSTETKTAEATLTLTTDVPFKDIIFDTALREKIQHAIARSIGSPGSVWTIQIRKIELA